MAYFSKELPCQQNGTLGPLTFRSWYEKKKGSQPVRLEDGAAELIPGSGWDKEQVGIKYELGPDKTRLYVTVSLANISLSHYLNVIWKQRPIKLKVILFPVMPAVGNRPVFGPAEPVVNEVDVTIPETQPDIDLDVQWTKLTEKSGYRIKVVASANLPPYISKADKAGVIRNLEIKWEYNKKNVTIIEEGVSYSDSGVTHTFIATPDKKAKPATATVVSSLALGDLLLRKEKPIQFEPTTQYLLNLSTNTVTLELPQVCYDRGAMYLDPKNDVLGRTTGSFEAWIYDVSSGKKVLVHEGKISVKVSDEVDKILMVDPKQNFWDEAHLECTLTSRGITDTHSVSLPVSAKVGDHAIPEKPIVTVFLNAPQRPVILYIEKYGFCPYEINISLKYPSLAKEILSTGGILEIPSIQGKCTLKYSNNEGEKEESFSHHILYANAYLDIYRDLVHLNSEKGYKSSQEEEEITIAVGNQTNPLRLPENITLELDEPFKAKLISLRQELNNYPSKSGSVSLDDLLGQYTEEYLRLFATEKDSNLRGGLAKTYVQRVANTWAFFRLGINVYPLLGRTEEITGKTIQRASENFLNFYLQVLMCLAPRISERITGYNAPKNADEIARDAKDIVDKEMRDEWHTIMVWFEGFKKNYDEQAKALFLDIQKTTGEVVSAFSDVDAQFYKIIDLIKKSVGTSEAAKDIEQGLARISSNYPKKVLPQDLTKIALSTNPAEGEVKEWLKSFSGEMQKHVTESTPVVLELDVFFESLTEIPAPEKQKIRRIFNSFAEKSIGIDMIQLEEKIFRDIVQLKKIEAMNKAVFAHIDTLALELDLDPLNSAPLKNILETIRLQVDQMKLDKQNWESLANFRNIFQSRLHMLYTIDSQTPKLYHYSESAKKALENTIHELNEVELDKAFAKLLEDGIQSFAEELLQSQPTAEIYNSIVDSQKVHNPPFVFLDGWGGPTYREYWMVPGAVQGFPPVSSARDVDWEKDKPWRDMHNFFQARQDGGNICLSAIESIFRMLNQACINWAFYWNDLTKVKKEVISELFNKETYEKVKKQYGQWGVSDYYFGVGSKYIQLAEQGANLQNINIIPLIPPRHEDLHKRQDKEIKKRILDEMIKPSQDERVNIINSIFYEAAKGALAPGSLTTAPEGITSRDLGKLNEFLNAISSSVQGFEQAYDRLEYYKKMPFLERQYTYFTNGLGEALAGKTSADDDQLIEWITYWGTWGFVIGSLVFPAVGWVSWSRMAAVSAGKELFGDVGLAYFQAGPIAHAELETVSGMYRDLLILFGIAYMGFFVEKVDFDQILKLETYDPSFRSTLSPDGLRRPGYEY